MTAGQPHRQPQFDKFVMIFVTEKGVKTFRGNHNQSAASYSLKDDSSIIDKASGCMIRNSPCILLGNDYTIDRLNSVNFEIFDPGASILNPHSSFSRAFQIIKNDSKTVAISRDCQMENQVLNFCVGDCVGLQHV